MNEQLKSRSTAELKVAVYDLSTALQQIQNDLTILNAEILERSTTEMQQAAQVEQPTAKVPKK